MRWKWRIKRLLSGKTFTFEVSLFKNIKVEWVTNTTLYSSDDFDGQGGVLGHALYPRPTKCVTEIHMDYHERWYSKNDANVLAGQVSFLQVFNHKIGHALGLAHSSELHSLMYPYYLEPLNKGNFIDLADDDIRRIQYLYRKPSKDTSTSSSTTSTILSSTTASTTSRTPLPEDDADLCNLKQNVKHFLIIDKHIYIVNDKLLWITDTKEKGHAFEDPQLLTNWLTFYHRILLIFRLSTRGHWGKL